MNRFTYIIVEYTTPAYVDNMQVDFIDLGELDWLMDWDWIEEEVKRVRAKYDPGSIERIFVSELVR